MRKVDSEVYTVRRDLINPPELLSWKTVAPSLIRKDALCSPGTLCSRGRSEFQVMACSDRWKSFLSFIIASRYLALYSYRSSPRLKSRRVKSIDIVRGSASGSIIVATRHPRISTRTHRFSSARRTYFRDRGSCQN